jgi:hypothetical protein
MDEMKVARTLAPLAQAGTVAVFSPDASGQIVDTGERLDVKNRILDDSAKPVALAAGKFVCVLSVLGEWHVISAEC